MGKYLKPYGEVQMLKLDSKNKTLRLAIDLKGESEKVEIEIRDYQIAKQGEQDVLIAGSIETSREWLNTVLEKYVFGNQIPIPPEIAKALGFVV